MWTLLYGFHEDRSPTHGYEATREAADSLEIARATKASAGATTSSSGRAGSTLSTVSISLMTSSALMGGSSPRAAPAAPAERAVPIGGAASCCESADQP